jgi:hypothetical protein
MPNRIEWTKSDAVATRDFFNNPVGQKFLTFLRASVPMQKANSIEEEALNWRSYKGGMLVLAMIDQLLQDPQEQQPSNVVDFVPMEESQSGRSTTKE